MKPLLFHFGVAVVSAASLAQEPVTTTGDRELSSPGDFNGDGRIDVALVDRASGHVRMGLQGADGSWIWSSGATGVDSVSLLAVGPFLGAPRDVVAVASTAFNRLQLWDPIGDRLSTWHQNGIGLSVLATHDDPSHPLLAVTDQNAAPRTLAADLFATDGASTETFFTPANNAPLTWGNPIRRREELPRQVAAMQGPDWICVSPDSPGTVLRAGLPEGSCFVNGRLLADVPDWVSVFWKPGSARVRISVHRSLAPNEWADGPDHTFPEPVHAVFVVEGQPQRLLVLFAGDHRGGLYEFANPSLIVLRQSFTAPVGQHFTTALSTANGDFSLFSGRDGVSEHSTRWTFNGTTWEQGATSSIPPVSPSGGRPNVFFFSAEPLVHLRATLLNRQAQGDWTRGGGPLTGGRRAISLERFSDPMTGLRAGGDITVADATASFALVNQLLPAASAASLLSGLGPPIGDVRFAPLPGRYPALQVDRGERLPVTLTASEAGASIFYRTNTGAAWTIVSGPIELAAPATIQAYSSIPGGKPGYLRGGTYTFVPRPTDLSAPPDQDANQNGLADAWETAFGQLDPNADTDGDGANALAEQNAGTDPQDAASRPPVENPPRIISLSAEAGPDGPILQLTWPAEAGAVVLQSSSDLTAWEDVVPQPAAGGYQILIQTTRLFFRLREP